MKTIDAEDAWLKEVATSIKNMQQLKENLELRKEEDLKNVSNLPIKITNYFLNVIKDNDILRRTVVPTVDEFNISPEEAEDPLDETKYSHTKCIVHKYHDKCLFLVTNFCSVNCRFCTRSRIFDDSSISKKDIDDAINYIRSKPQIRDVILSGGDILTLSNDRIEYIVKNVRDIDHVEIIRLGTKVPVVLPSRITDELVNMLKKYHPLYMSIHFTHPSELTKECRESLRKIADAGIVMKSQTVLLKGINDNIKTMKELMHKLLINRVSPYYIYYPDYVVGTSHFRPSIDIGISIISELRKSSGYCVPNFIVDSRYGKIVVSPENIIENNDDIIKLRANHGEILELKK